MNTALLETINRTCEARVGYGLPPVELVSSGIPQLDAVMGGIPRGRIVEIYGGAGSGKTALALHLAQRMGGPVLYIDADHGLSPYILAGRELYLLNVDSLEDALDACRIAAGGFSAIVLDTVAALPTREDLRCGLKEYGAARKGQASVMAKALPILAKALHSAGCTLFLVEQLRDRPGVFFGRADRPTGGRAAGYFAALRLETHWRESVHIGQDVAGHVVLVDVAKCKYGPPFGRAAARLMYGEGLAA